MEYPNLSGDEFKKIVNLFKVIVIFVTSGLTILVTAALIVSYKDVASMRTDLRNQASDMKEEIAALKSYSQTEIKNAQDYSIRQINITKEEALTQAKLSANLKIQEIFEDNRRIREMIEETAEKKLYTRLNEILDMQLLETEEILKSQVKVIPSLISATDRIRVGSREALEYVDSLRLNAERKSVRELAETIFQLKKEDYFNVFNSEVDTAISVVNKMNDPKVFLSYPLLLKYERDYRNWQNPEKREIILSKIILEIRNGQDLNEIAIAFLLLIKWGKYDIEFFDFARFDKVFKDFKIVEEEKQAAPNKG